MVWHTFPKSQPSNSSKNCLFRPTPGLSPGRLSGRKDNCILQIHRIKAVAMCRSNFRMIPEGNPPLWHFLITLAGRLWLYLACVLLSSSFLVVCGSYLAGRLWLLLACVVLFGSFLAVSGLYLLGGETRRPRTNCSTRTIVTTNKGNVMRKCQSGGFPSGIIRKLERHIATALIRWICKMQLSLRPDKRPGESPAVDGKNNSCWSCLAVTWERCARLFFEKVLGSLIGWFQAADIGLQLRHVISGILAGGSLVSAWCCVAALTCVYGLVWVCVLPFLVIFVAVP